MGRQRGCPGAASRERGAAAVEFALVVPILLGLVFAIIQYSLFFWATQTGTSVANNAVRRLSVGDCQSLTQLTTFVTSRLGSANASGFTISRSYKDSGGVAIAAPTPPATTLPPTAVGGTVSLTIHFQTPDLHLPIPFMNVTSVTKTVDARIEDNSQDSAC